MDKSGRVVWDGQMEYSEMRKPHGRSAGGGATPQQAQHILSPEAKEFVPRRRTPTNSLMPQQLPQQNHVVGGQYCDYRNSQQQHNRGSAVQERLKMQNRSNGPQQHSRSNASSNTHHQNPAQSRLRNINNRQQTCNGNAANASNNSTANGENQMTYDENFALNYITEAVKYLNDDPGLFDVLESHLKKAFNKFGNSEFVLSNAMEIVFVQSIEEQNFRYMGARLYRVLDALNPVPNSVFRRLLNCKLTYHQEEVLNYMNHEQAKVRATTLFLAELYMQLKTDGNSTIKEIAHNIIFTINQLLHTSSPENIKCICLTLKLCGYELEQDSKDDVNKIIENLNQKVNNVDVGTGRVLETVLQLQKNNWGRSEVNNQPSPINETPASYSDLPVFYGPDGEVLTEEENSFLESQISQDGDIDNDCDDCDIIDPDLDMDPEVQSAYESFLKQKPKSKDIKKSS